MPPKQTRYRVVDTLIVVSLTMAMYLSWQLSSDPGLGSMFLDAMCDGGRSFECAANMTGTKVAIRGLKSEDADRLFDIKTSPGVADHQLYDPPQSIIDLHGNFLFPYMGAQLRKNLIARFLMMPWYPKETRERRVFAVTEAKDPKSELIGIVGVYGYYDRKNPSKEVHYELHPNYWRRGYMTEALSLVISHVFGLPHPVDSVTARTFAENVASVKLLKKLGFTYDKIEDGMQVYRLGKENWLKTQKKG
ncbi:acyl-CoA N-acyltransferase [Hyaloraphidium curvatum]|nr:acyl-CoA N-acyltransferase [Hyaloraphidium curvatum]